MINNSFNGIKKVFEGKCLEMSERNHTQADWMDGGAIPLLLASSKRKKYFLNSCNLSDSHWSWGLMGPWCCPGTAGSPWGQGTWKIACSVSSASRVDVPHGQGWTVLSWAAWSFQCVKDMLQHQAGLYLIDTLPALSITLIFLFVLSWKNPCRLFCFHTG